MACVCVCVLMHCNYNTSVYLCIHKHYCASVTEYVHVYICVIEPVSLWFEFSFWLRASPRPCALLTLHRVAACLAGRSAVTRTPHSLCTLQLNQLWVPEYKSTRNHQPSEVQHFIANTPLQRRVCSCLQVYWHHPLFHHKTHLMESPPITIILRRWPARLAVRPTISPFTISFESELNGVFAELVCFCYR